jgi:deoxyribose-phosphate aldolase
MSELAKFLEHTILKPDTTLQDVNRVCEEALRFGFGAVCIPPPFVKDARRLLGERNKIRLATVVGFPMGYSTIAAKSEEIKRAMDDGADDIDAVVNISAVKSAMWNQVSRDVDGLALATQTRSGTLKLILECGLLTNDEIQKVCACAASAGVPWLKTGTGFLGFDASVEMVRTLRSLAGNNFKIKAAGGIRTAALAQALLDAGADKLGTSKSVEIVTESAR